MSIEISEIDLQRYCQKTFWTIHEAICITLHTNPRDVYVELPYYSERYRDVFWNEFKNLENLISESSEKKELIIKFNTYSHIAPKVKVIDYISWVKKKEQKNLLKMLIMKTITLLNIGKSYTKKQNRA